MSDAESYPSMRRIVERQRRINHGAVAGAVVLAAAFGGVAYARQKRRLPRSPVSLAEKSVPKTVDYEQYVHFDEEKFGVYERQLAILRSSDLAPITHESLLKLTQLVVAARKPLGRHEICEFINNAVTDTIPADAHNAIKQANQKQLIKHMPQVGWVGLEPLWYAAHKDQEYDWPEFHEPVIVLRKQLSIDSL